MRALELGWLGGGADDGGDPCAHGKVLLSVAGRSLVVPDDGLLAVSAAGLYLLRTLEADHVPGDGFAEENQLFPCCGHFIFEEDGRCVIWGCPNGVDMSVITTDDTVTLSRGGLTVTTTRSEWRRAVLGFAEQVETFYSSSVPRAPIEDYFHAAGWRLFWHEWHQRTASDPPQPRTPRDAV